MSAQTIAILRRHDELVALESCRKCEIAAPRYGDSLVVDPYEERIAPLDEVTDLGRDYLREIQVRWQRLASVTVLDQSVVSDMRVVLAVTIPDDVQPIVDPWRRPVVPKLPRASAAHPRAFRGTKFQPPAPPQVPAVDLRPHLCNLRDVRAILEYVQLLDLDADQADEPDFDLAVIQDVFSAPRPLRLCLWMISINASQSRAVLAAAIGHYWALQLDDNPPLRRAIARLLREPWRKESLEWLQVLPQIAPHRREALLVSFLENVHDALPLTNELASWLRTMSELTDDESFFNRSWALAQAIRRGASIGALLSGFLLSNRYQPDHDFVNKLYDDCDASPVISEWIEHVRSTSDTTWNRETMAMRAWDDCGLLSGLAELLDKQNWDGLSPEDALELFNVFRDCCYAATPEAMEISFEVLLRLSKRYFHTIRCLPVEYREKGIRLFAAVTSHWEGKRLEPALQRILELIPVVCKEPFDKTCESRLYASMLCLSDCDFTAWRSGSLESLLALDRASRNHNEASLIAIGLERLTQSYSRWLVEAIELAPGPLLKCAHTFGCLSKTQYFEAMQSALHHPVARCEETDLIALGSRIVEHLPRGVHDPVPRKVKAMLNGEVVLTASQASRAVMKIHSELARTKIELARQAAVAVLAKALGVTLELAEPKAAQHAVKLQNMAMENRRALRKFLRAYLTGKNDYLNQHAANLRWLKRHPAIQFDRWRNGISRSYTAIAGISVTLSVELNPLEALQLGSYVGSCLGIGGMLAASAAAVVLDINKTVVYARNQRGKVIARQLLAIAENDQLVAFSVYPDSTSQSLKEAFAEFDRAFAAHLDIALYQPNSDEGQPEIERPISSYWWDDSAWGFE
jgi:hypothetical protein